MKFTLTAALVPLAVSAASIPRDEWTTYDQETTSLKSQNLCRSYSTLEPPERATGLEMCDDLCNSARELSADQSVFSQSCIGSSGQGIPDYTDPEGARYVIGECHCNHPLVNWVVEGVIVEGLPAIGRVTCAVWKLASSEAAQLIAGTLTGMGGGAQTLAKVAQSLSKLGNGASDWESWVREHSEGDEACDFSPGQLFEDFTGLSEEDLAAVN